MQVLQRIGRIWPPEPEQFRELPWVHRRRIDWQIYRRVLFSNSGLRALAFACAAELIILSFTWRFDLFGWPRDLLRTLAVMSLWVWIEYSRRRHLAAMFRC